jgi:Flp pilus assembly protein TadD
MSSRWLVLASFLLLFVTLLPAQQWYAVQTDHLVAYSAGDDHAAREAARRGETLIATFSQILHRRQIQFTTPLCILALRDQKTPAIVRTPVGNYVSVDLTRAESWGEAARAITLLMLDENYPRAQPWFDRGIAGYLAGARINGEQEELGWPPPGMTPPSPDDWIPLSKVFAINTLPQPTPAFESESWALVRWIVGTGRQAQAGAYMNALQARGATAEQSVSESFLLSIGDLDREVRESLAKPLMQKLEAPRIDQHMLPSKKLSPADVEVIHRNLTLFSGSGQELTQMVAFMRENQEDAGVHRSLAWAFMLRGDQENAIEHIRRALALNDNAADMHYLYALWVNEGDENAIRIESAEPRLGAELKEALRRNPSYAPAWELLGLAQLSAGDTKSALISLQRATALRPRQSRYYLNTAAAEEASGNLDAAKNLLLYARGGDDPAVTEEASARLGQLGKEQNQRRQWAEMGITASKASAEKPGKYDNLDEAIAAEERKESAAKSSSAAADTRTVEHLSGTLSTVDCAASPGATLSVLSRGAIWTFHVADRNSILLIGPDRFDCAWRNVDVSLNYKQSGKLRGDVVSLETH